MLSTYSEAIWTPLQAKPCTRDDVAAMGLDSEAASLAGASDGKEHTQCITHEASPSDKIHACPTVFQMTPISRRLFDLLLGSTDPTQC